MHVALLRAVNLAGHNRVAMADLRKLLADLGLGNPRTLLASGNAVFESEGRTPSELEALLEGAAVDRLGLDTDFLVRTARQWTAIVDGNPFLDEARREPRHLQAMVLKSSAARDGEATLRKANPGREEISVSSSIAYVFYPEGIGRSRLTTGLMERHLGTRVTGRNWNTVLKLQALLGG